MPRRTRPRQARRAERAEWERYQMTQKLLAIGNDFFVENQAGKRVFRVDGKALRIRDTLVIDDLETGDTYRLKEKLLRIRDTMTITKNGRDAARVKRALITPLRDRFTASIPGQPDVNVQGNVLNHEYKMTQGGQKVAEVSKRWFRIRDTYGVEVSPAGDRGLLLAIAVVIDMMVHPMR